jgi:hypothetical protein
MKGRHYISIIAAAALLGATVLLGAGALVINQSKVPWRIRKFPQNGAT